MNTSNISAYVGIVSFTQVRTILTQAFGSNGGPAVTDDAVAATIEGEWAARAKTGVSSPALSSLPNAPAGWAPQTMPADGLAYYNGTALHERSGNEVPHSRFNGELPMARVPLPATTTSLIASTAIGYVFANDHLLPSVESVKQRMVQVYGAAYNDISAVDLVTPCRMGGRFGAIGVYLGYRGAGATPSFYVLEAGLATGAPVRIFTSPDMSPITSAPTAYFPTPFVEPTNTYDGSLSVVGNDPTQLQVRSYREPRAAVGWRIQVTVTYAPANAQGVWKTAPGDLTLLAAERIAAIGSALGETVVDQQAFLAAAAKFLQWLTPP